MTAFRLDWNDLKVLVVDDSRTARLMLISLLKEIPVGGIAQAEDGTDAIVQLKTFPADIVLCDLHMAPLDGIQFTRLLRNADDSPNPYVPVLMLTADATEAHLREAVDAGVHGLMSKPVNLASLRQRIETVFARPLVYLREGRYMKPVLASCGSLTPLTQPSPEIGDPSPTSVQSKATEEPLGSDDATRPLTRADLPGI
jgi:DNA-binding NarL/FixJ family response regulator